MDVPEIAIIACQEYLKKLTKQREKLDAKTFNTTAIGRFTEIQSTFAQLIREKGHESPEVLQFVKDHKKEEKELRKIIKFQGKKTHWAINRISQLMSWESDLARFIDMANFWRRKQS